MRTAMVLCAGYGTRLKELTYNTPKTMLPINGKPLLEYILINLSKAGIDRIIINLHYFPQKITSYFEDGKDYNISIEYSFEEKPLGTAGAVDNVRHLLKNDENFFVIYGDIITNQDFKKIFEKHKSMEAIGTIVLHKRKNSNSIVKIDKIGKITQFIERPDLDVKNKIPSPYWVNSGLYCFNKSVLNYIKKGGFSDFPKDVFPKLIEKGKLYGVPIEGYRCAVDSPERYDQVCKDMKSKKIIF